MNMLAKVGASVAAATTKAVTKFKVKSPVILLGVGIVAGAAAVGMAVVGAKKEAANLEEPLENLKNIKEAHEEGEFAEMDPETGEEIIVVYDEKEYRKDLVKAYIRIFWAYVKTYGWAIALELISVTCHIGSYKKLNGLKLAAEASAATVASLFEKYRQNVVEDLGEEADERYRYGIKKASEIISKLDEDGNAVEEKIEYDTIDRGIYAVDPTTWFFDASSVSWTKDTTINLMFLKVVQETLNNRLKYKDFVLVKDVLDELRIPIPVEKVDPVTHKVSSKMLRAIENWGWVNDGTDYISLGVDSYSYDSDPTILIKLNCRPNICAEA